MNYYYAYIGVGIFFATMFLWFPPVQDAIRDEPRFGKVDWVMMSIGFWWVILVAFMWFGLEELYRRFK